MTFKKNNSRNELVAKKQPYPSLPPQAAKQSQTYQSQCHPRNEGVDNTSDMFFVLKNMKLPLEGYELTKTVISDHVS